MQEHGGKGSTPPEPTSPDERIRGAWHAWLRALATDPEAAISAALSYEALDATGRARWLDALDQDAPQVGVPKLALYAPLLSVETEPEHRARIEAALSDDTAPLARPAGRALWGVAPNGDRIVAIVLPLYLSFVHVLACRFRVHEGIVWVRREPIVRDADALRNHTDLDGVSLEPTPLKLVVEELAHAIVAHRRSGNELPAALGAYVDLFSSGQR
jgi:hypothetical protein